MLGIAAHSLGALSGVALAALSGGLAPFSTSTNGSGGKRKSLFQ